MLRFLGISSEDCKNERKAYAASLYLVDMSTRSSNHSVRKYQLAREVGCSEAAIMYYSRKIVKTVPQEELFVLYGIH